MYSFKARGRFIVLSNTGHFLFVFFHRGTRGAIAPPDSTDSTVELYSNKSWSIILLIPTFYKMTSLLNPKPTSVTSLRAGHYNCCVMIYLNCTSDTLFSLVGTLSWPLSISYIWCNDIHLCRRSMLFFSSLALDVFMNLEVTHQPARGFSRPAEC